jgi:hypothetical protein
LEGQKFCGNCCHCCCCLVTIVVAIVIVVVVVAVAVAITIAIAVIAGCCHCHQDNKFLTVFGMLHVFLQPQTGDRQQCLCPRTEGDGLSKPKAWEVARGFAQRPVLLCILWCVCRGCSGGVGDDGGPHLPPPKPQVPPLFVGTCIYANVPRKQHRSVGIVGGEGPQDSLQVCLVLHPITFRIDQSCGKMIVVSFCHLSNRNSSFISPPRSNLSTGRREMLGGIVRCWLTEPTFRLQRAIPSPFGVISSKRAGCGMRWGCPFKRATSAGGAGRMPQVNGTTSQSSGICWSQCWSRGKGARWIGAIKAPPQPM